jgi:hypothetical protein
LALIGTALEQDAAYWEWHIKLPARTHVETILFGVAQKKDRKFYHELEDKIQPEEGERDRSERMIVDRKFMAGLKNVLNVLVVCVFISIGIIPEWVIHCSLFVLRRPSLNSQWYQLDAQSRS